MLEFLLPKTKVQAYDIREIPLEDFEMLGIGQINPYCAIKAEKEKFITIVNIVNNFKNCDEKEGLVLTDYFELKKCPKCRKISLLPCKIRVNLSKRYRRNPQNYVLDYDYISGYNVPSQISAYCTHCSSCFEIHIKHSDLWVKQAKKINNRNIIGGVWDEYKIE